MMSLYRGEPISCFVGDIILETNGVEESYWFVYRVEPTKYMYNFNTYFINVAYCWDISNPETHLGATIFHDKYGVWSYKKVSL